jgi:hypothetical protein
MHVDNTRRKRIHRCHKDRRPGTFQAKPKELRKLKRREEGRRFFIEKMRSKDGKE